MSCWSPGALGRMIRLFWSWVTGTGYELATRFPMAKTRRYMDDRVRGPRSTNQRRCTGGQRLDHHVVMNCDPPVGLQLPVVELVRHEHHVPAIGARDLDHRVAAVTHLPAKLPVIVPVAAFAENAEGRIGGPFGNVVSGAFVGGQKP